MSIVNKLEMVHSVKKGKTSKPTYHQFCKKCSRCSGWFKAHKIVSNSLFKNMIEAKQLPGKLYCFECWLDTHRFVSCFHCAEVLPKSKFTKFANYHLYDGQFGGFCVTCGGDRPNN